MAEHHELRGVLLGMGSPLLDISAEVPAEFLAKYNLRTNNAILAEPSHLNLVSDLTSSFRTSHISGGSCLNTMRVAQWMSRSVSTTSYIGCVGADQHARDLQEHATNAGVHVLFSTNTTAITGTCAVLVHDRERSLVANLGAASTFQAAFLESEQARLLTDQARVIYIEGYFLTSAFDSVMAMARHAASSVNPNKMFCLNLSAEFIMQFFGDQLNSVLPYCDIIFGNETEALKFGECKGLGTTSINEIALKISSYPKSNGSRGRIVLITQGSRDTVCAMNGQVSHHPVQSLAQSLIIDSNGAGDAFVGGFMSQWVQGRSIEDCVQAGHWAARIILQHEGCSFPNECTYVK